MTVRDNIVTFEAYDQMTYAGENRSCGGIVERALDGTYNRPPVLAPIPARPSPC